MFQAQIDRKKVSDFFRVEEQSQLLESKKNLRSIRNMDQAIKEHIYRAFEIESVLRRLDYFDINIDVKNSVVYLDGHIVSRISNSRVENILRAIPRVLGIENSIVVDDDLAFEVTASLEKLECACQCEFFASATHGVVSLNGIVKNENTKLLAEQCVASHPSVRSVINNLHILGARLGSQDKLFL